VEKILEEKTEERNRKEGKEEEMNSKKAKKIRKLIYGDHSYRQRRYIRDEEGTIRCIGLRRAYKEAKKMVKRNRRQR